MIDIIVQPGMLWTDGSPTALLPIEYLLYWGEKGGYTNIFFHPPRAKDNFGSCPTPFRRIRLDKFKLFHRIGPQIISIGIGILLVFQFQSLKLSCCRSASCSIWKLIFYFDRSLIRQAEWNGKLVQFWKENGSTLMACTTKEDLWWICLPCCCMQRWLH